MEAQDLREQLTIIHRMIERSRRETADSGRFFVWIGVAALVGVVVIASLEQTGRSALVLPALIALAVISGIVGYLTLARAQRRSRVRSYASAVSGAVWLAVGVASIILAFVLPLIGAYGWGLVPVLVCIVLGVGVFSTGAVFDMPAVAWCAVAWWGAGVGMAFVQGSPRAMLMALAIGLGWVLPGVLFGRTAGGDGDDA